MTTLIYCAAGNPRFMDIAIEAGLMAGACLPNKTYHTLFFADQNWKKPDQARYISALAKERPAIATVIDIERDEQLKQALEWAEEAAPHVSEAVILIPKVCGIIPLIPETIGGRAVRLGYSVPTAYGGTPVPVWEFGRRAVHLLGGGPDTQLQLRYYLNVQSADGNYLQKLALLGKFWHGGKLPKGREAHWARLDEVGLFHQRDGIYEAFSRSVQYFYAAWNDPKTDLKSLNQLVVGSSPPGVTP